MKLSVSDLRQGYYGKAVLEDINFEIRTGELVSILGPNGSGKSTLIKTICNVLNPMSGNICIDDVCIKDIDKKEFAKRIAYVPQTTMNFGYSTVFETVLIGRRPYIQWNYSDNDLSIVSHSLEQMHIKDLHDKYVTALSGGQRQRVHIARALAQNSDMFVLDEPTSSLDLKHQIDTMGIMRDLTSKQDKGAVVALHDLNLAMNYSDRVIVLCNKGIYADGKPKDVITEKMIEDVYGVRSKIVEDEIGTFVHPHWPLWDDRE